MNIVGVALGGMQAAQQSVEATARRVASPDQAGDTVDLSAEMVALLSAKNQFAMNAQVVHIADQMQRQVLDLFG
jgi:flagellar basal body rod protein FlgG